MNLPENERDSKFQVYQQRASDNRIPELRRHMIFSSVQKNKKNNIFFNLTNIPENERDSKFQVYQQRAYDNRIPELKRNMKFFIV